MPKTTYSGSKYTFNLLWSNHSNTCVFTRSYYYNARAITIKLFMVFSWLELELK